MTPIGALLMVLAAYGAVGVAFAVPFALSWVKQIDPVASSAPLRTRLIFLPGAVALWPILARKLAHARKQGTKP